MEQLVAESERILTFKNDTEEGDLVVVAAAREPQFLAYAIVGPIERDESKREEWWHVTLHMLGMPIQTVIWTLREPQFTGREIFTMGGVPHYIRAIALPSGCDGPEPAGHDAPKTGRGGKLTRIK